MLPCSVRLRSVCDETRPGGVAAARSSSMIGSSCDRPSRAASEDGILHVEFRVTHPDGSVHWLVGKGQTTQDSAGVVRWLRGTCFDITERKVLEVRLLALGEALEARVRERTQELEASNARLRESERRFRLLVEGVTDYAIYMLDPEGKVVSWNPGAERIKGYPARKSSASTSPASTPRRTGERTAPDRRSRPADRDREIRSRGLAREQGRQPLLGERRHQRDPRRGRAVCSASPRSPATHRTAGKPRNSFARRRRWRRSAS